MNMLQELLKKKKSRDSKKTKAQDKKSTETQVEPTQPKNERPLARVFNFLQNRQETRLGVLYSLTTNRVVEEPVIEEQKKVEVSYIG